MEIEQIHFDACIIISNILTNHAKKLTQPRKFT